MKALAPAVLLLLAGCGESSPPSTPAAKPSVLVGLQKSVRGSVTEWLAAYGIAAPAMNGSVVVSVPQPGQLARLAVSPGAAIRAGQLLAIFTVDPAAVSSYQQAVTSLSSAQKQRATTARLLTQQLVTRDQLTQADKAVADAQTALDALRKTGAGQPTHILTAPFSGVVTAINVAQGDRTQPGAPLMTIARGGSIVATVGIDPPLASRVRIGQKARVSRLDRNDLIYGRVIRVDAILNPKTRLIDVNLSLPADTLLPNEAVKGEIAVGVKSGWIVPHRAVVTANDRTRVYQNAHGKAQSIPVILLLTGQDVDVVKGALNPDWQLIVDGAYQVADGEAVRTH